MFFSGYIRGAQTHAGTVTTMNDHQPLSIEFSLAYKKGAIMAVAWDNGTVTFVTHRFLTDEPFM